MTSDAQELLSEGWWVQPNNGGLILPMIAEGSFREHEVGDWPDETILLESGRRIATKFRCEGAGEGKLTKPRPNQRVEALGSVNGRRSLPPPQLSLELAS